MVGVTGGTSDLPVSSPRSLGPSWHNQRRFFRHLADSQRMTSSRVKPLRFLLIRSVVL